MNSIKNVFTIKDLENISGIKAHTIRIWEKRYNLLQPNRSETNIRSYNFESLKKLLNVVLLIENGVKISKVAQMSDNEIVLQIRELNFSLALEQQVLNSFKLALFQFDKYLFNEAYNRLLKQNTFRELFKQVFIPFFNYMGFLWQSGTISSAHEHFISSLMIQKLQIHIEALEQSSVVDDLTYVLFLPENEFHEITLLYLNYELLLRGFKTIFLGQNLAISNLDCFLNSDKSFIFLTNLTVQPYDDKIDEYFDFIDDLLEGKNHRFVALGRRVEQVVGKKFKSDIVLHSSLFEFLDSL